MAPDMFDEAAAAADWLLSEAAAAAPMLLATININQVIFHFPIAYALYLPSA